MRDAIYIVMVLASVAAPAGAMEATKADPSGAGRLNAPIRLDLRAPAAELSPFPPFPQLASAALRDRSAGPSPTAFGPLADAARGALTWVLPTGWSLLAAGAFGANALTGHAASPLGGAVPAMRATAAIGMTLDNVAGSPVKLNLSVSRNWQLDAPIGGAYLDCTVRLDVAAEAAPSIALQAPCGTIGHFGVALRGRF